MSKRTTKPDRGLVGKFFYSFRDDRLHWQGQVVTKVVPSMYLVQLFEWIAGCPTNQQLVTLNEMRGWAFYDDADDWTTRATELNRQRAHEMERHVEQDSASECAHVPHVPDVPEFQRVSPLNPEEGI